MTCFSTRSNLCKKEQKHGKYLQFVCTQVASLVGKGDLQLDSVSFKAFTPALF